MFKTIRTSFGIAKDLYNYASGKDNVKISETNGYFSVNDDFDLDGNVVESIVGDGSRIDDSRVDVGLIVVDMRAIRKDVDYKIIYDYICEDPIDKKDRNTIELNIQLARANIKATQRKLKEVNNEIELLEASSIFSNDDRATALGTYYIVREKYISELGKLEKTLNWWQKQLNDEKIN